MDSRSSIKIEDQLMRDMKTALKSGDKLTLETIRMIRAQLKNAYLAKGKELKEEEVIHVLNKEAKRRKESLELYQQGGRDDLAEKESQELKIIHSYLPKGLKKSEVEEIINQVIKETGAESPRDMGRVMGEVMSKVKGRAEGKFVQELVKIKLS